MINTKRDKAKVADVTRAFWRGMRSHKLGFYTTTISFIAASTISVFVPLYYKRFFDLLASGGVKEELAPGLVDIIVLILILHCLLWLMFRLGMFTLSSFEANVMARLKQMSFEYIIHHSHAFFSGTFTGSLVQRVNRFSRGFERLYDTYSFNFIPLLVNVVGSIIVVYYQEPIIAWIVIAWVLVTMICNYLFSRWKVKYDIRSAAADSATTGLLADTITNQNAVASFVGAEHETMSFKEVSQKQARATRLTWQLSNGMDALQGAFWVFVEFFVFYYAIRFWTMDLISLGTFVLIQAYIIGLGQHLWDFGRIIRNVYESYADSEEMVQILNTPHEVKDRPHAKPLRVTKGAIKLIKVSFNFGDGRVVLRDVSLKVSGGEKVALVGPSGSGKSTLVRLIVRFFNLKKGVIEVDGQDIQKVTLNSLRHSISAVPQDPVLFHRSLLENIRYGRRDASDQEVMEAARLAHCDEFIESLPARYDTLVGERGIKLSGGERQRIAIARAILKNAPILILDEATSSLDSHSELLIQDALDKLMKGKTTIVIAHRLSTIRKMDRIIVLDKGEIIEDGTHEDLLTRDKSLYRHLWELQAGGFLRS